MPFGVARCSSRIRALENRSFATASNRANESSSGLSCLLNCCRACVRRPVPFSSSANDLNSVRSISVEGFCPLKASAASSWPLLRAASIGVLSNWPFCMRAPFCSSRLIASRFPFSAAWCRAVLPLLSLASSGLPALISSFITAAAPFSRRAASISGVVP